MISKNADVWAVEEQSIYWRVWGADVDKINDCSTSAQRNAVCIWNNAVMCNEVFTGRQLGAGIIDVYII